MKKYISIAIFFGVILGTVEAQHINVGIKGGINGYTIKGNNNANYKPKLGFNLGVLGHIHLNEDFALQPEIVYSLQGTKYKSNGINVDLQLNYLNVPILFQYMFDNGFRLELGPQLGILASAKSKVGDTKTNVSSDFKKIDLGVAAGLSYVRPSTGFGFDIRYNHGFTNINASNATFNTYNRGVQLGLFYLFQHKS